MKRTTKCSLLLALPVLIAVFIAPADASTSVVHDPRGDRLTPTAPPYLDVAHARVVEKAPGTLLFMMQLARPIPEQPSEAVLIWPFHVDTVPNTLAGNPPLYNEYIVRVRWANGVFDAHLVNRTSGVATPIPFRIAGATVHASVELGLLGNPSSFGWNASTRPGATVPYEDFAPDGGTAADLATWSQ